VQVGYQEEAHGDDYRRSVKAKRMASNFITMALLLRIAKFFTGAGIHSGSILSVSQIHPPTNSKKLLGDVSESSRAMK
jgi:hypothetical protein